MSYTPSLTRGFGMREKQAAVLRFANDAINPIGRI
jgi:hypothetical protein